MSEQAVPTLRIYKGNHPYLTGFNIVWGMYVNGFNAVHHCKKCLRGYTSAYFKKGMEIGGDPFMLDESPKRFHAFYLCGVSAKWVWKNNLHIVAVPSEGDSFIAESYNGYKFEFQNAKRLEFNQDIEKGWRGYDLSYTRCRNFQFGVDFYGVDNEHLSGRPEFQFGDPQTSLFSFS